jgi:pimeloyl-ACP methyl ester carboxylesterase
MMRPLFRATDSLLRARLRARGYVTERIETRRGPIQLLRARGVGLCPPLVVLHGLAAAGHFYDGVFDPMRPFVRAVLAPDLPGHGKSPLAGHVSPEELADALGEALAARLDEPAILFGNSLGGAAALRIAHQRPALVAGLFLVAPGGAPMTPEDRVRFLAQFEMRSHADALEFVDNLFAERHPLRHVLAWGTRHKFAQPETRALLARVDERSFLSPHHLTDLTMPVHVVWGGADRILSPEHLAFFRSYLPPHARVEVVPHFGHTPQMDHPRELHGRLRRFVERVADESPRLADQATIRA